VSIGKVVVVPPIPAISVFAALSAITATSPLVEPRHPPSVRGSTVTLSASPAGATG
jgi:hypothetical protein